MRLGGADLSQSEAFRSCKVSRRIQVGGSADDLAMAVCATPTVRQHSPTTVDFSSGGSISHLASPAWPTAPLRTVLLGGPLSTATADRRLLHALPTALLRTILVHMAGRAPIQRLTTQRAGQRRIMSGFTPTTPSSELTGLQDVLAFIADFEMDENQETKTTEPGKMDGTELGELLVDGGRPPTSTTLLPSSNVVLLQSTSSLDPPLPTLRLEAETTTKTPRRHRVSRKEELEYLRKKVKDMQDKLQQLRENSETSQTPPPANKSSSPESSTAALKLEQSVALWKTMAERQKSQREMVESENSKLREKLKTQVRMAKSLQRILHKRERAAEQISGEISKRPRQFTQDASVSGSDAFHELVQGLSALYSLSDSHLSTLPIVTVANPVIREQDVKYDDLSGMFIEFKHSRLVPFAFDVTCRAIWRFTSEKGIKFNSYFDEYMETSENMVLRKFGVEIKLDNRVAKMSGRQAHRRHVGDRRMTLVRNSAIDRVEMSDTASDGITFRDIGWVFVRDVTGQDAGSGPMTLVQSYSTFTPDIDLDAQWELGSLTDFVLQSRADIEAGNDSILENLLFRETAAMQKS